MRLLSFGKSKKKYKNPDVEEEAECVSEEVSLMEESFEALSKFWLMGGVKRKPLTAGNFFVDESVPDVLKTEINEQGQCIGRISLFIRF